MLFSQIGSSTTNGNYISLKMATKLFRRAIVFAILTSLLILLGTIFCFKCTTLIIQLSLSIISFIFGIMLIMNVIYTGALNDPINPLRLYYLEFLMRHKFTILAAGFLLLAISFLSLYHALKYRKYIKAVQPLI